MQYMHLFLQCTIYVQDLRKIVLISPMRNICARFAQDCTFFPNAQYMCKICTRLYLFLQCAIYVQDLHWISQGKLREFSYLKMWPPCRTSLKVFMCSPLNGNHHLSVVSNPTLSYLPYFSQ